jgi:hypothetical protein
MVYPTIRVLNKKNYKKSNNYWMLYKIPFESFDWFMVKCSYYSILLKECKGIMHKMMQLISNFFNRKNMLPFIQLYVCYVNFMKKKITWKFQSLEILKQRDAREMILLLNNLDIFLYPLGSNFQALDACDMCRKE